MNVDVRRTLSGVLAAILGFTFTFYACLALSLVLWSWLAMLLSLLLAIACAPTMADVADRGARELIRGANKAAGWMRGLRAKVEA